MIFEPKSFWREETRRYMVLLALEQPPQQPESCQPQQPQYRGLVNLTMTLVYRQSE
jgi:hypothetical protein